MQLEHSRFEIFSVYGLSISNLKTLKSKPLIVRSTESLINSQIYNLYDFSISKETQQLTTKYFHYFFPCRGVN